MLESDYADAAVRLDAIAVPLAVFFRASGGPAAVTVVPNAEQSSAIHTNSSQSLDAVEELLTQSFLDQKKLHMPPRIALFNQPALNRDLYFWLAALLATMTPSKEFKDPLQRDINNLRHALSASKDTLNQFPGLHARYARLQKEILAIRPTRALPPTESAIEAVICRLLGSEKKAR